MGTSLGACSTTAHTPTVAAAASGVNACTAAKCMMHQVLFWQMRRHLRHQGGDWNTMVIDSAPQASLQPACRQVRTLASAGGWLQGRRSECSSPSTTVNSVRAPAWCAAPSDTGTYVSSVEMPNVTCGHTSHFVPHDRSAKARCDASSLCVIAIANSATEDCDVNIMSST